MNVDIEKCLEGHPILELIKEVKRIKIAGYRNAKIVRRLIRLTADSYYKPSLAILRKNLLEAAFLGDERAI